jgi:hypothetical protein
MVVRSTQPLTEITTRNFPGDKGWPEHEGDNLTAICESIVYKDSGTLTSRTTLWASMFCYRESTHTHSTCKTDVATIIYEKGKVSMQLG